MFKKITARERRTLDPSAAHERLANSDRELVRDQTATRSLFSSPLRDVAQPIAEATWNNYHRGTRRPYGLMEAPALLRKLERIDPSYRS